VKRWKSIDAVRPVGNKLPPSTRRDPLGLYDRIVDIARSVPNPGR